MKPQDCRTITVLHGLAKARGARGRGDRCEPVSSLACGLQRQDQGACRRSLSTGEDAVAEQFVELAGEYDLSRKAEVGALFESLEGNEPLVIDLAKVTYLDSTLLNELSVLRRRNHERQITLRGANANIRRILNLVNFGALFRIADGES